MGDDVITLSCSFVSLQVRSRSISFSFFLGLLTRLGLLVVLLSSTGTPIVRVRTFRPFTRVCTRLTSSNLARLSLWRSRSWETLGEEEAAANIVEADEM